MRKLLNNTMILCSILGLITSMAEPRAKAQSVEKRPNGVTATATAAPKPETGATKVTAKKATATVEELVALLPASDGIGVIDAGRAFNDLLPRLAGLTVGGVDKLAREIQDFTGKTGIDPSKIQTAVISLRMNGTKANGAVIVQGVDLDDKKVEAAIKAYHAEFNATEYKGKQIFNIAVKAKGPSAGSVALKTDETSLATLGQQRLVFGDLGAVKNVIDIQSGAAKGGVSPAMVGALKETKESALIRFALNLPENLRQEASNQGDLFKSVAAIKLILGTFDVTGDFNLSLDTILRTASQNEAAELETGLKGLVSLVKGFLTGGDPKADLFNQLLAQVKIGSKLNDVSLSINLPRALIDQLTKKPATGELKKQ